MGHIVGLGARHALGTSPLLVAFAARAHKLEPRSSRLLDSCGQSIGVCRAIGVPDDLAGPSRWLALAAPALADACRGRTAAAPLFLAMPERGRADDEPGADDLLERLARTTGIAIDLGRSRAVRAGRAGGGLAFAEAVRLLASGEAEEAIVGGVDSFVHEGLLAALDEAGRVYAIRPDGSTVDGFIPSEAAAFVRLSRRSEMGSLGRVARVETRLAVREPSAAMADLLHRASVGAGPFRWVMTDLNGEPKRLREWFAIHAPEVIPPSVTEERLDDLGEIGAAAGPLLCAIACTRFATGCAPAARVAVALASDGPERAAMALELGPDDRPAASVSSARRQARAAVDALERALLDLAQPPMRADTGLLAAALSQELEPLERLAEGSAAERELEWIPEARSAASRARRALESSSSGASLAASIAALEAAEVALAEAPAEVVADRTAWANAERATVKASVGTARRARLSPPEPRARGANAIANAGSGSAIGEDHPDDPLRRLARDAMEELGMLGGLRTVDDDERWDPDLARFEERLLADYDLLSALGSASGEAPAPIDLIAVLAAWAKDGLPLDPSRAFAQSFVLACAEGDDARTALDVALREADPATYGATRSALVLAPSSDESGPTLGAWLAELALRARPALAALALDAARARNEVAFEPLATLLRHADADVAASAACALGSAPERARAVALLTEIVTSDAARPAVVAAAAAETLARMGSPAGIERARRWIDEDLRGAGGASAARATFVRLLSLVGADEDEGRLWEIAERWPELAEALGWFGRTAHVDGLIARLGGAPPAIAVGIASALHRLTGMAVPARAEDQEEADGTEEVEVALAALDEPRMVETDPAAWQSFWEAHRATIEASGRVRSGRSYSLGASFAEIVAPSVPQGARRLLALEIALATGGSTVAVDDWVPRQREQLRVAELSRGGGADPDRK